MMKYMFAYHVVLHNVKRILEKKTERGRIQDAMLDKKSTILVILLP